MLKILKNLNGQGVTVQYATTFAIVLALVLGMSTYFKRAVQSRYAGARDYARQEIDAVFNDTSLNLAGNFTVQYEPYYHQSQSIKETAGTVIDRSQGGVGVGSIQSKEYQGYRTSVQSYANQLAPRDAY